MKMIQESYKCLNRLEIQLKQLDHVEQLPIRPVTPKLSEALIQELVESAYPTPLSFEEVARQLGVSLEDVIPLVEQLQMKGVLYSVESGIFTRAAENFSEVEVVRHMPTLATCKRPTIAIITSQYCEKLAVDAMMDYKQTYVRYTTVGESNVYTLGTIGKHQVVSTKLPVVGGGSRGASIATGNGTTRLLGTFQHVEYVFLVGVCGGVPHITDYTRHVRLGDVVVSCPTKEGERYIYLACSKLVQLENSIYQFDTSSWGPPHLLLQNIAYQLVTRNMYSWLLYLEEGMHQLEGLEMDFHRPPQNTDKLFMSIGENDLIEVSHPACPDNIDNIKREGIPRVHLGLLAGGKVVVAHEQARLELARQKGILAFDAQFDAVIESIYGNRKDHYIIIRGVSDYRDGSYGREWQPYAALAAASFTKALICHLDPLPIK